MGRHLHQPRCRCLAGFINLFASQQRNTQPSYVQSQKHLPVAASRTLICAVFTDCMQTYVQRSLLWYHMVCWNSSVFAIQLPTSMRSLAEQYIQHCDHKKISQRSDCKKNGNEQVSGGPALPDLRSDSNALEMLSSAVALAFFACLSTSSSALPPPPSTPLTALTARLPAPTASIACIATTLSTGRYCLSCLQVQCTTECLLSTVLPEHNLM